MVFAQPYSERARNRANEKGREKGNSDRGRGAKEEDLIARKRKDFN